MKLIVDTLRKTESYQPLTDSELEAVQAMEVEVSAEIAAANAAEEAKEAVRQSALAKLSALGLTEEEVKAILGV